MQLQSLTPPIVLDAWLTIADEQRYAAMVGVLAGTKHPTTEFRFIAVAIKFRFCS